MRALVYTSPHRVELRDMPAPEPGGGEFAVRIEAAGICGSDMHAYLGHDERRPPPLILGHEAAGVILSGPRQGARVTINPLVTCGACAYCRSGRDNLCPERQIISMPPRPGAFAEQTVLPDRNLLALPDDLSFEKAAMTEPLACGWHAARLAGEALSQDLREAPVLVIGGGAIGLAAALGLRARGAERIAIAEKNGERRRALREAERFEILESADAAEAGFPLVIDAHGDSLSRAAASRLAAPGGVIVHIGLAAREGGLDARRVTLQEIAFIGAYTYTAEDFRQTLAAMADDRLGGLDWFASRPLEEGPALFEAIHEGRMAAPKTILHP